MNEEKFNGMGAVYTRFRPQYPQEFLEYLYWKVGLTKNSTIADIGSGTGILTKQLLEKGSRVFAVEPNMDMQTIAQADLKGYEGFMSVNGTAENTTLAARSVDFITVAQAFHWFDRRKFLEECRRIIKPGGRVILVWNSRDEKSGLVRENDAINKKYCPKFKGFSGGMRGAEAEDDFHDFFCGAYESTIFRHDLIFNKDSFIGRNLSSSYALKESDAGYAAYVSELMDLFEKYSENGTLFMPNLTRSYVGAV